jgi:uncharacterized damage-inducible protein DinB
MEYTMRKRASLLVLMFAGLPSLAFAQGAPVATAFRDFAAQMKTNLIAAAEEMPAADYGFKPTPAQMSYGTVLMHLAQGNDLLCGAIGGAKAPTRTKVAEADGKDALVARLKETFAFCDATLAGVDDSKLTEEIPLFGKNRTRAAIMTLTTGDWAAHYSQMAIYLRLKGQLPPTAKKP